MSDLLRSALDDAARTADPGALPAPAAVRARGRQRTRRTALVATSGAVLAVSITAVVLTRPPDEPPRPPEPAPSPTVTPTASADVPTTVTIESGKYRFSARAIAEHAGRFVVVGDSSDLVEDTGPPVYWSADGVDWHRPEPDASPESVNVTDVIATESGFVAVGIGSRDAAAWKSGDGRIWTPVPVEEPAGPSRSSMWGVTRTRVGLFATGFHAGRARLWRSTDGSSWALATSAGVFDVLAGRETICAIRDAGDEIVATGVAVPEGGQEGRTVSWTSVDGSSWSRTDDISEPAEWCDPTREQKHWQARTDTVRVRIEPYGAGNLVEVTGLGD